MRLKVWTFAANRLETGAVAGLAAVCAEARYISVAIRGADRLQRRFAQPAEWIEIEHQLKMGISPGPLPRDSYLGRQLLGAFDVAVGVRYVHARELDARSPELVVPTLDGYLLSQAGN
jgi:hypothetical protein